MWSQYGARGQGIIVGSIDSGVDYTHVALEPNYLCGSGPHTDCWLDPGDSDCEGPGGGPCEASPTGSFHGTHTLATAVGLDDLGFDYIVGMAPGSQWIACLGCPSSPAGCPEYDTTACADWMLAPGGDPAGRPHVVSNSWGADGGDLWFQPAVNAWRAAGIFPAFSAGNGGPGCSTAVAPGSYQESMSTAAHDGSRLIAGSSSRGPASSGHEPYTKPNLSAPGVNVISAWPGDGWVAMSGTSTASPHTAGAVALVWSACPQYTGKIDQTIALLANSAGGAPEGDCDAPPDGEGNYTYGYGYLDVLAAVQQCSGVPLGTLQGQVLDGQGYPVEGAVVAAKPAQGGAGVQVTSGSNGDYGLDLRPGTYVVTASKSGYLSQTIPGVVVTSGQTTVQGFTLDQWGTLEGHVRDQLGNPVEGASVYIEGARLKSLPTGGSEGAGVQATTDPNGFYTFQLLVGTYDVTAAKPGYTSASATGVVVAANQTTVQDLALTQLGTLQGHVYDQFGGPVEGATVGAQGAAGGGQTITGPDGFCTLSLPPGAYDVTAYKEGYVTVTVTGVQVYSGQTTELDLVLEQHLVPDAAFSAQPTSGLSPLTVQFTDESTGTISSWLWDFGDGTTGTAPNPLHGYVTAGRYTVSLTVSSLYGSDTLTRTDYIAAYAPVHANFSATPRYGVRPLTVAFTNLSVGDYTSSLWDFGDGSTSAETNPSHVYTAAGSYAVSLTVSGPGGTNTLARAGYIVVYEPVNANFSGTPTTGIKPLTVAFTNTSTGDYTSSSWWFGDGGTSSAQHPSHTYVNAGMYKVTLAVGGPGGTSTLQRPNYITVLAGRAHVKSIVLSHQRSGGQYKVIAKVTVVDQNNVVVPGAKVYATWTLPNNSTQNQQVMSNTQGVAQFSVLSPQTGTYQICVTNIAKTNWAYDPAANVETCDSRTVP